MSSSFLKKDLGKTAEQIKYIREKSKEIFHNVCGAGDLEFHSNVKWSKENFLNFLKLPLKFFPDFPKYVVTAEGTPLKAGNSEAASLGVKSMETAKLNKVKTSQEAAPSYDK